MTADLVELRTVFCPSCANVATVYALGTGPQLVNHSVYDARHGTRCTQRWVAAPDLAHKTVELIPVHGRAETEQVLRTRTAQWLEELEQVMGVGAHGYERAQ